MARYEINGGHPLNGTVTISGAKNAAVAILPAALLVSGKCRIENVPNISDVRILLSILDGMGAKLASPEPGVVEIDCTDIQCSEPDQQLVRRMRASYYLMGALLGRFGRAHVALPGGETVVCHVKNTGRCRELLTPDEVRRLDNRYAILLIRGAGPVMDLKYDLMKHPAVRQTSLAGGPPYIHHRQNQAPVISGHEFFAAFSTDDTNENKENAA